MELRQLEYFVAVAEERHFTRAAERMHVAQSGLSASIRSLERELGASLFVRNTRSVELTNEGRALLSEARHALSNVAAAKDAVAAVRGLLRGRLAVGTLQCLGAVDLPAVLARFHAAHPGVEIRLRQGGSADLVERVRTGDLDLAFVSMPASSPTGVTLAPIRTEPMVLACGPDHPLRERAEVDLGELAGETFVDFSPGWISRDVVDQAMAVAGVDRRVAFEVNDVHWLLDLVSHGLGVAVVPQFFTTKRTAARFAPITDPPCWNVAVATASGRHPSTAATALMSLDGLRPRS
ncbi:MULTISPECIES: LysR family transcriptional regulator [unclassified Solwaraspora]|uniref:LysR family transcriptional regulator n=1 Tax=unclassified Solwaraspora TaxID=2627926 RepID=UPI00248B5F5A|nr:MULTISPECIES: LysR family transcriptional regulator [unclassified Solwaraspora]WBB99233.1 LysR family transcriptional regulator [Solwaraspora sp. WMMA2059]WBC22215.1 LysR family transcriptional regulator [Solwaraspora sp. WMMA2080]WJK35742.1 LysR family transcriptional regulator [Solwaraspora sp. WMMA2065]